MGHNHLRSRAIEPKTVPAFLTRTPHRTVAARRRSRVLMVGTHLTKTRGGITTLAAGIIESDLKREFDFIYIASQAEDFGKARKLVLALKAAFRFLWNCLFNHPRLVYIHLGSNASLYRESAFILIAKLLGKRVLAHFHAGDVREYLARQPKCGRAFIGSAIGLSNKIIAASEESARCLRSVREWLNITVIPNAIDTSLFDAEDTCPDIPNTDGALRLLFVGAVGKLKGERDLVQALALLKDSGLNIRVDFLGFGAERLKRLCRKAGISQIVGHLGPVPTAERAAYFHRADIFVLPTYAEAMPISVIEAMAAGKAIITTPVGGIPELITNGEEGLLVSCGNVEELSRSIAYLVRHPEARRSLGEKARQRVRKQMNFTDYIGKLRKEISRVCGRSVMR